MCQSRFLNFFIVGPEDEAFFEHEVIVLLRHSDGPTRVARTLANSAPSPRWYKVLIFHSDSLVGYWPFSIAWAMMSAAGVHWTQAAVMPSPFIGLVKQAASPMTTNHRSRN
jgi:hypothetical protein